MNNPALSEAATGSTYGPRIRAAVATLHHANAMRSSFSAGVRSSILDQRWLKSEPLISRKQHPNRSTTIPITTANAMRHDLTVGSTYRAPQCGQNLCSVESYVVLQAWQTRVLIPVPPIVRESHVAATEGTLLRSGQSPLSSPAPPTRPPHRPEAARGQAARDRIAPGRWRRVVPWLPVFGRPAG